MGKEYKYGPGYQYNYAPAPTAPTMEITINQGAASEKGPYPSAAPPTRGRPPVSAPPPPPSLPPSYGYEHPAYNPMWFDRFPRRENRGMFRLCLVELIPNWYAFNAVRTWSKHCNFHLFFETKSFRNWALVGTYHHPRIDRDEAFCLLGTHDSSSRAVPIRIPNSCSLDSSELVIISG
ncbi:unnamed protein product [Haemonchus placei]|uniref:MFMR domain-containing protein n=1 Tax=Haemonchus placei TaxID=6290 RepID=A0A0N4W3J0_HAEPC|nr:unnamed protein product [Haemonchus placei]